jgi:hypothetical protein
MSIPLLRPAVSDLVFQVYNRPLHPEFFDILATRKVQHEKGEILVHITRTGHVISWQDAVQCITEVTAASDQEMPESHRLLSHRLRGEHHGIQRRCGKVRYQASFQVEVLPLEIFLHIHDEIRADGQKRGLFHDFQPNHRLGIAPLGFITVEARPGCLFLTTFHTFPSENTVVKSQSLIERA